MLLLCMSGKGGGSVIFSSANDHCGMCLGKENTISTAVWKQTCNATCNSLWNAIYRVGEIYFNLFIKTLISCLSSRVKFIQVENLYAASPDTCSKQLSSKAVQ